MSDVAICVRRWDWSETSQTVSLFARGAGLIRGIAKGAKRERAPFSGGVELMTKGGLVAIVRGHGKLATITEWDLIDPYPAVRRSLEAFYVGSAMLDLIHAGVTDEDPHQKLFDVLDRSLGALGDGNGDEPATLLRFQWALLGEIGLRPELSRDVSSGGDLEPARIFGFSPRLGGLTVDPGSEPGNGTVWRVRSETVELLRGLERDQPLSGGRAVLRANQLLGAYAREVLEREVHAMRFLFGPKGLWSPESGPGVK